MNILNLFSVKLEWIRPHNVIYKEVIDGGGSYEIEKDTYILGSSCEKFVFHHSDGTKTVLSIPTNARPFPPMMNESDAQER